MKLEEEIYSNICEILKCTETAAVKSGRKAADIKIVAVSKKQSVEKMKIYQQYCLQHTLPVIFGESYVQEFRDKKSMLDKTYETHLIGNLQSNKAKDAVFHFDLIESVDSLKLAAILNKEAEKINKIQNIFLQINISNDALKHGFETAQAEDFISNNLPGFANLRLGGFMTITKDYDLAEESREDYKKLTIFRDKVVSLLPNNKNALALSMGMSHDYQIAIEEGADLIRIGTALFGERYSGNVEGPDN